MNQTQHSLIREKHCSDRLALNEMVRGFNNLPSIYKVPQFPSLLVGVGVTDSSHRLIVSMKKTSDRKVLKHL